MRIITGIVLLLSATLLPACTSLEKQESNQRAQIEMIKVQREAKEREERTDAQAKAALYEAISKIAATNPEHSPAALVALTAISMSDSTDDSDTPLVALREQRNEALEWTKALAPSVGNLITGLGTVYMQTDLAKTQSDNSRKIQINDADSDVAIVEAVAGLGVAAANQVGVNVGGDYYAVQDQGIIDQSQNTTNTTDSYNDNSDNSTTDNSDNSTADNTNNSQWTDLSTVMLEQTVTFQGGTTDLSGIIDYLIGLGTPFELILNGEVIAANYSGGGETTQIFCSGFSPQHPDCI